MVKGVEGVTKVYVNPHVAEVINFRNGYVLDVFVHFTCVTCFGVYVFFSFLIYCACLCIFVV
jgi:hypothetical protein